ncbi:CGNR zinc finger domain-containing protein [Amycolatopsis sp. NPDC026612]|uniref:CGNR zinc finger domain-containing protein n=1 Tax=Amycolatopsis sp. NPDC026612 TaxID=3155466 RepID=UPI0033DE6D67
MTGSYARNLAPPELEPVRCLLNSWSISHRTREPEDLFDEVASGRKTWSAVVPVLPRPIDMAELRRLRDDLRDVLGEGAPRNLARWLERYPLRVVLDSGTPRHAPPNGRCVEHVLALVVDAVAAGTWKRLRACPDCRRVFYDRSRNLSRTWCGMYAEGPDGRACGSIAKVRRYRKRAQARLTQQGES